MLIVGLGLLCSEWEGGLSKFPGPSDGPAPRPAVAWMGAHSRIIAPRFVRVATPEAWADLWHEHTGEGRKFKEFPYAIPPEIDFSRFMVVAYFRGASHNSDGERVESIDVTPERVRIRFESAGFQTASVTPGQPDRGVPVEPFGIWVIDRTNLPIVIEENVQELLDRPPVWKERHQFEALRMQSLPK
jgi:hypothetical protein